MQRAACSRSAAQGNEQRPRHVGDGDYHLSESSVQPVSAFRLVARVGVIVCLLIAAVVLAANTGEYPGLTRPAFRHSAREVLPLVVVAVVNLVALDYTSRRARLFAPALNVVLLAYTLIRIRSGAPPIAFALCAAAALLVIGSIGVAARGGN